MPNVPAKRRPTNAFQPGNKLAVGHKGRNASRPDFLTQALISQLHEIDKDTSQEKLHLLAHRLLCHAIGGSYKIEGKKVIVESSLHGIKETFDRVQGKAPQTMVFEDPEGGGMTLRLEVIERVIVDPVKTGK